MEMNKLKAHIKQWALWCMVMSVTLMAIDIIFTRDIIFTLIEGLKVCGMVTIFYIFAYTLKLN